MNRNYRETRLAYRQRHIEQGLCTRCTLPAEPGVQVCAKHRVNMNKWGQDQKVQRREKLLDKFGRECACCGEREPLFLAIDHMNGGGKKHIATFKNLHAYYNWLLAEGSTDDFQTLCHNCNHGRSRNGGVCPHETAQDVGI